MWSSRYRRMSSSGITWAPKTCWKTSSWPRSGQTTGWTSFFVPNIFIYLFLEQKKRRKNIFIYALTFLLSTYNYQWLAVCVLSHGRRIANVDQIIGCDGQVELNNINNTSWDQFVNHSKIKKPCSGCGPKADNQHVRGRLPVPKSSHEAKDLHFSGLS